MFEICIVCGIEFIKNKYATKNTKFCSIKCRSKVYYNKYYKHFDWKINKKCDLCSNDFIPNVKNQKYCYKPCNAKIAWRVNNREKDLNNRKLYNYRRKQNIENILKDKICNKNWKERNKVKIKYYKYKRRALLKIGNGVSEYQWNKIKDFYNHKCLCCLRTETDILLTIDHIIPLSLGGLHEINNIQPLCHSCNSKKQQDIIDYRNGFYPAHNMGQLVETV